jgi:hypothetical protein
MHVQLVYRAPVAVGAGTATATVERVVVLDEDIALDAEAEPWDQGTWQALPAGSPVVLEALRIAESAEWPEWEHGW